MNREITLISSVAFIIAYIRHKSIAADKSNRSVEEQYVIGPLLRVASIRHWSSEKD